MSLAFALSFLAPLALMPAALFAALRPGQRPGSLPRWSEASAFAAFALALGGLVQTALGPVAGVGLLEGAAQIGLRADLVSTAVASLVGFIGWIGFMVWPG